MRNSKVLIIDDDKMTCQLLETFLQLEDYDTAAVTQIENNNIIHVLDQKKPDIILMDYHLGSNETLEYLKSIRADEKWQNLPVIMTSAIDYAQVCKNAGANDFIVKPFNWKDVAQRIDTILGDSVFQEV